MFCYVDIVTETFSSVIEYVWESRGKYLLIGEEIDLFVSHAFEFRFTLPAPISNSVLVFELLCKGSEYLDTFR